MRIIPIILLILTLNSCENRKVKYSGLNDLVVGVQQIILYENGEFYLELGAGGVEGKYRITNDTVLLNYHNKPENWPDKILITKEYFEAIKNEGHEKTIKIYRPIKNLKTTNIMTDKFQEFKNKEKFIEDNTLFYPGIADPAMRPILTEKINLVADDFIEVVSSDNPTDKKYQEKIEIGLKRFSDIYINLDTEDRERVCSYFEELMDIVGLESSNGQLNEFLYGFD